MKIRALLFFIGFLPLLADSQSTAPVVKPDTILFNNGKVLAADIVDSSSPSTLVVEGLKGHKHKKIELQKEDIFSVKYTSTGKEQVYYIYDTLIGHDFTVDEARKFIAGEQDARRGFHAVGVSIAAFSIGFASGVVFGSAISFGPPFLFDGIMTYPVIRVRHNSVSDMKNVTFDAYLYGYDQVARQKRTLHSFVWSGVGLVTGIITNLILLNNQ